MNNIHLRRYSVPGNKNYKLPKITAYCHRGIINQTHVPLNVFVAIYKVDTSELCSKCISKALDKFDMDPYNKDYAQEESWVRLQMAEV